MNIDWTAIIAAFVTSLVPLAGVIMSNSATRAVMVERVDNLKTQVEKHNGLMERTFKLEADRDNLFHRYEELRDDQDETGTIARDADKKATAAHNRLDKLCLAN